jgi:hypothetical protein
MKEPVQLFWIFQVLRGLWKGRYAYHQTLVYKPVIDTLPDLSQFFSILTDLKCYRSAFSSSTNHLWNAKPKDRTYIYTDQHPWALIPSGTPTSLVFVHKITTFPSFFLQSFSSHLQMDPCTFCGLYIISLLLGILVSALWKIKFTQDKFNWGKNE